MQSLQELKKIKQNQKHHDLKLRQHFKDLTYKLRDPSTKQMAVKQLQQFLNNNKTTENIRIWISVLTQKSQLHHQQILVIGYIAKIYGRRLLDPLDKTPSLAKTSFRLLQLIQKNIKIDSADTCSAARKSWVQFYRSVLNSQSCDQKKLILYDPLQANMTGGTDRSMQINSAAIAESLIQAIALAQDQKLLRTVGKSFISTFIRIYMQQPLLFDGIILLVSQFKMSNLQTIRQLLINKILFYLTNSKSSGIGIQIKISACQLLKIIANQSFQLIQSLDQNQTKKVCKLLQSMTLDRVWKIQHSSRQALKHYQVLSKKLNQFNQGKNRVSVEKSSAIRQSISPQQLKNELIINKPKFQQEEYFGGSKLYVKKKTGSGGGRVDIPIKKDNTTANYKKNQIKQQIQHEQDDDLQETMLFQQQLNQHNQENRLADEWRYAYQKASNKEYQQAYSKILQTDDDLHLVRMMAISGNQIQKLSHYTSCKTISKFTDIVNSRFMQRMLMWITQDLGQCKGLGFVQSRTRQQIREQLINIQSIDSDLSEHAQHIRQKFL